METNIAFAPSRTIFVDDDDNYSNLFGSRKRKRRLEAERTQAEQEAERLRLERERLVNEAKQAELEAERKRLEAEQKMREEEAKAKELEAKKQQEASATTQAQAPAPTALNTQSSRMKKSLPLIIGGAVVLIGIVYVLRNK